MASDEKQVEGMTVNIPDRALTDIRHAVVQTVADRFYFEARDDLRRSVAGLIAKEHAAVLREEAAKIIAEGIPQKDGTKLPFADYVRQCLMRPRSEYNRWDHERSTMEKIIDDFCAEKARHILKEDVEGMLEQAREKLADIVVGKLAERMLR